MADFVIVDQDLITWMPTFGAAVALAPPQGNVIATAATTKVTGKAPARQGDETSWQSTPVPYISPPYVTPGTAIAKVVSLGADQVTTTTKCEGKPLVIKGSVFQAQLEVLAPAMMPTPAGPVPDPVAVKPGGQGQFVNSNLTVRAS